MVTVYKYKLPITKGKAYLTPPELIPDKYYLSAYYPTNTKYRGSYIEYMLYLNQAAAKGEMDTTVTEYYNGEYLTPIVHFSTNENHLVDVPVLFRVDNDAIGEYRTDENGVATAPPYMLLLEEGEHKLSATIPDGPGYIGTTITQTFTTKKSKTKVNIDEIEQITRGNVLHITGNIESDHPFHATTTSIELKYKRNYNNGDVEPVTLTQTINLEETTSFQFDLTILPEERPGYNYITVTLPKNEYQNSSESSQSFIIYVQPRIDVQNSIKLDNRYYTFYGQITDEFGEPYYPPQSYITTYTSSNRTAIAIPIEIDGTFVFLQSPEPAKGLQQTRFWELAGNKYHSSSIAETEVEYNITPLLSYEVPFSVNKTELHELIVNVKDQTAENVKGATVYLISKEFNTLIDASPTDSEGNALFTNYTIEEEGCGEKEFIVRAEINGEEVVSSFSTYLKRDLDMNITSAHTTMLDNKLLLSVGIGDDWISNYGNHYLYVGNDLIATNFIEIKEYNDPNQQDIRYKWMYKFELPLGKYPTTQPISLIFDEYIAKDIAYNPKTSTYETNILQPLEWNIKVDGNQKSLEDDIALTVDNKDHIIEYEVKGGLEKESVDHGFIEVDTQLVRGLGTTKTKLTIVPETTSTYLGKFVPITMTLTDLEGNLLANEEIELYQEGSLLGTLTTNETGTCTRTVQIDQDTPTITYTAKYKGTYIYGDTESSVLIAVEDHTPVVEENTDPITLTSRDMYVTEQQMQNNWYYQRDPTAIFPNSVNGIFIIGAGTTATFKEVFTDPTSFDFIIKSSPDRNYEFGLTSALKNGNEIVSMKQEGTSVYFAHKLNGEPKLTKTFVLNGEWEVSINFEDGMVGFDLTTSEYHHTSTVLVRSDKMYFFMTKTLETDPTDEILMLKECVFNRR